MTGKNPIFLALARKRRLRKENPNATAAELAELMLQQECEDTLTETSAVLHGALTVFFAD
jgi:hypothetical protein